MGGSIKAYTSKEGITLYSVRYYCPDPATGERKQKYKGGFRRKKDAQTFLATIQYKISTNTFVGEMHLTLADYLEDWLKDYVQVLKQSTRNSHTNKVRTHIITQLGYIRLQKLTGGVIKAFYKERLENGRVYPDKQGSHKLSFKTVSQVKKILTSALNDAVKVDLLAKNPATGVSVPVGVGIDDEKIDNFYTPEELEELLNVLKGHELEMPVMLAVYTGLRRGELLGLTWENVDTTTGRINVMRTLNDDFSGENSNKTYTDTPKSDGSVREIYMPMSVAKKLAKYRLQRNQHSLSKDELDFVFRSVNGTPYRPSDFSRHFTDLIQKYELPYLTVHGLRHTYATKLLSEGKCTIFELSKILGHSSIATTSKYYGHLLPTTSKKIAALLDSDIEVSK